MVKALLDRITKILPACMIFLGFSIALVLLILIGYSYEWTGFGASTFSTTPNQELQLPKKLWDWLDLLVIPLVLAISAAWFSRVERINEQAIANQRTKEERSIADDRAQEAAIQVYLEQMSTLLTDKALRQSEEGSEVRAIARALTLTFLRRLNGERKGTLLRFLYESDLITTEPNIISLDLADINAAILTRANLAGGNLEGANLAGGNLERANLAGSNLERANLAGSNLERANLLMTNLHRASLQEANMHKVNLHKANLLMTNLHRASLKEAILVEANLQATDLREADLREADLREADLREASLERANLQGTDFAGANLQGANLERALYSTETIWPKDFDPEAAGAILFKVGQREPRIGFSRGR